MANSLLLATIFRTGFVIISYGARVPAGIFVPSMAVGATFGRMVGIIVKAMYRCVRPISPAFVLILLMILSQMIGRILQLEFSQFANQTYRASHLGHTLCLVLQLLWGKPVRYAIRYRTFICRAFRRGVMRITLSVVVIMFELTGALTYILPTMVRLGSHV